MFNFDYISKENIKEHNTKWPEIPDHPYRILITGGSGSGKIVHFNDENNFLHKLLLTNTQISRLHKVFANNSSANINLSKIQIHKIGQSGGVLDILLRPLLKTGLLLIGNVLKPLVKSVLKPLELTAVAPATDAAIYQNIFGS